MPTRPPLHRPTYAPSPPPTQSREAYDRQRGSAASRGYDHRWRKFRASVLASNPLCADCLARGVLTSAADVHHVVKLRDAPGRRLDPTNVLALCGVCHSRRTGHGERFSIRSLTAWTRTVMIDDFVPGAIRLTLVGGAIQALREIAPLMHPGDPDAPTLQEALAKAIGSQMTPLRLSRLRGVTF
jgi:5-methylcytosine-specific restriction protein A